MSKSTLAGSKAKQAHSSRPSPRSRGALKPEPSFAPAKREMAANQIVPPKMQKRSRAEIKRTRNKEIVKLRKMFGLDPYEDVTGASIIGMLGDLIEPEVDTVELLHEIRDDSI